MNKKISLADVLMWIGTVVVAVAFAWIFYNNRTDGMEVRIQYNGAQIGTYSIFENREIPIGEVATVVIEEQSVFMKHSSCPDDLCVKQGKVGQTGQSIICLPNEIVIEVIGNTDANELQLDAISQ